ncbi:MAG: hypothetical protein QFF03_07005 [Pseudomonadota bacterium]|nr:hypothetical protein [Pseudomonadota bacterium]
MGALVVALFFRQQIVNGFTLLSSDRYDGVIFIALLEHWFNVLRGLAEWNRPHYFFPYAKTLGYNDGYFLYGLIYALFRGGSLDPLLSGELVNVVLKALGFGAFLLAARRMLGLSFWWALLGAALFTLANNSYVQVGHAQLLAVAFVPLEALLMHEAWQALLGARRWRFVGFASAAVLLYAAWGMSAVYTAWFFGLFTAIFVLTHMLLGGLTTLAGVQRALRPNKLALLAVGVLAVAALAPFADAYWFGPHGPRAWDEVALYSPSVFDSVNVGAGNLLFGDLIAYLKHACRACDLGGGEREAGIAPLLFALAALAVAQALRGSRGRRGASPLLIGALALASTATWLLAVRVGTYTGWHYVYALWPGATGLRVVARIFLFLSAPACALAVWYLSGRARAWPRLLTAALCCLLLAEEKSISGRRCSWTATTNCGAPRRCRRRRRRAAPSMPAHRRTATPAPRPATWRRRWCTISMRC